jgi:hypothetical protein
MCYVNILSSELNYTNIIFHNFRFCQFGIQFCFLSGVSKNVTVVSGITEVK